MEMMHKFASKLVQSVEVTVKVVAAVIGTDEATVAEPFENTVDGVAIVAALFGDISNGPQLVEVIEYLEGFSRQ